MKAETVRRGSHDSSEHKIAQTAGLRDPSARTSAADRGRDRRDSRWDEHRRTRREQLVDAAVAAVGRHGAGVGMEEIAAEAGTSKTVVYRHFADRGELHRAVCHRVAGQLLPKLREAIDRGTEPRAMVAAAIETYLAFLEADPALYRFVVHGAERPVDGDPIDSLGRLVAEQAAALVSEALRQAGRDEAAGIPWGHGLVGMVRAAADWWLSAESPMLRSVLAAHLTELAWAGLSGVVTPPVVNKEEL
jgi:AcrR family transcriptional regulator